jgi:acyl carrier protein
MIAEVENEFGVKFKLKELISMKNVGDMIRLIIDKKQA